MASNQRTEDFKNGTYMRQGGVADTIPDEAPQLRSAVMIVHGEKAHSCYMGYDQKDKIPFDRIEEFLRNNLK